jgi:hypothetical protein
VESVAAIGLPAPTACRLSNASGISAISALGTVANPGGGGAVIEMPQSVLTGLADTYKGVVGVAAAAAVTAGSSFVAGAQAKRVVIVAASSTQAADLILVLNTLTPMSNLEDR